MVPLPRLSLYTRHARRSVLQAQRAGSMQHTASLGRVDWSRSANTCRAGSVSFPTSAALDRYLKHTQPTEYNPFLCLRHARHSRTLVTHRSSVRRTAFCPGPTSARLSQKRSCQWHCHQLAQPATLRVLLTAAASGQRCVAETPPLSARPAADAALQSDVAACANNAALAALAS